MRQIVFLTAIVAGTAGLSTIPAADKAGADLVQWKTTVDKAVNYMKSTQAPDGSWSKQLSPGVTGIVLTGLLRSGQVKPTDEIAAKALKFIESLVNEKEGHVAGQD